LLFHSVVIQSYALGDEYTALEVPNLLGLQQDYADIYAPVWSPPVPDNGK
jgi:hypothetical protein